MHNPGLLREALGSIARWRDGRVLVHVDLDTINQERDIASVISDVALLKYAGIDIRFTCVGETVDHFTHRAAQRGIETRPIGHIKDITSFVEEQMVAKIFFLCEGNGVYHNGLIREMTAEEVMIALDEDVFKGVMREKMQLAVELCVKGVKRVHFANGKRNGAFLAEFLSDKGSGTMIYGNVPPYKLTRRAEVEDVVDIASIIRETVDSSVVEEVIMQRIEDVTVFSVDGYAHAVIISFYDKDESVYQIDYLAHAEEFDASEAIDQLLQYALDQAKVVGARTIVIDPNRAPKLLGIQPWFLRRGYVRRDSKQRNSNYRWWQKELS